MTACLDHLKAFSILGEDAVAFIQSQLTCHIDELNLDHWHPGAWCNAQGRVIATLLVRVTSDRVDCILPKTQINAVMPGLQKFTIGRDVMLQPTQSVIGGWPNADEPGHRLSIDPQRALSLSSNEGDGHASGDATSDAAGAWWVADIHAGWAWLTPELSGAFLPQALGLERLNGLSYEKGCYPGQEVIAKIHYRGRLKQRLVRLTLPPDVPTLPPAAALYTRATSASDAAHPVGQIIHHHQSDALAVVKTKIPDGAELLLQPNGATVGRVVVFETDAQDRDLVS